MTLIEEALKELKDCKKYIGSKAVENCIARAHVLALLAIANELVKANDRELVKTIKEM